VGCGLLLRLLGVSRHMRYVQSRNSKL
jgi:hypothetical protein